MSTTMLQPTAVVTKPLGLVWINCHYPVLSLGIRKVLAADAEVFFGQQAPPHRSPSCVILCPEDKDVSLEVKRLRGLAPNVPIVVFDMHIDLKLARTAMQAGARGFIHAKMQPGQIVRAVSLASQGEVVVPRELLEGLVGGEENSTADLTALTPRQLETLELLAEGHTNAQIASQLFLSEFTVKQHLRAAYKVLGVKNRLEAAKLFRQYKW